MLAASERQYAGNLGYDDDPVRTYRYASNVPNSRRVPESDVVPICDAERLLGIASIERIERVVGTKRLWRCPVCGDSGLRRRRQRLPEYRCDRRHEFDHPVIEEASVTQYAAHFGNSFAAAVKEVRKDALRAAAIHPNGQFAIEEVDPQRISADFASAVPGARRVLA